MRAEAPSPVVVDFVAGEGTLAVKNYNGYWLGALESGEGAAEPRQRLGDKPLHRVKQGRGVLVLYNFGAEPAELSWSWPAGMRAGSEEVIDQDGRDRSSGVPSSVVLPRSRLEQRLTLAPGERREIAVELSVRDGHFAPEERRLAVEVRSGGERTVSRWATRVYPLPRAYAPAEGRDLLFAPDKAAGNRAWLRARPHAAEEPRLRPDGAWLVTPGVRVEETATGWRFHVEALPGFSLRPARAELPLPDDWAPWETGLMLSYDYRIAPGSFALRTPLRPDDPDVTRRLQTGKIGDLIESYLRTETGNLYSTQPRLLPTPEWKRYNQTAETFTPHFPGRLAAPLRVQEERPASLVFFLRPAGLPTVFEIEKPRLAHWRSE